MQPLLIGLIVLHGAMPQVLANYPERQQANVDGYVAVDDCGMIGQALVLVRSGRPDLIVAVADCAADADIAYRQSRRYIADVETAIWTGPVRPQPAELWLVEDRARWEARWSRATVP